VIDVVGGVVAVYYVVVVVVVVVVGSNEKIRRHCDIRIMVEKSSCYSISAFCCCCLFGFDVSIGVVNFLYAR
jgi:hypothetical protein